ncbi:hypothetical protein CAC42_4220 [Sphaceloma murrayae]|uniref:Uncharacterized protein n=1 Tax=Sphaceloma murrayae TaxID=2082308 RepID=A0A2K1QKS7_9PEZI|nr:hypothetical protein CAC42_4220 [Sphaceloma murrayae]
MSGLRQFDTLSVLDYEKIPQSPRHATWILSNMAIEDSHALPRASTTRRHVKILVFMAILLAVIGIPMLFGTQTALIAVKGVKAFEIEDSKSTTSQVALAPRSIMGSHNTDTAVLKLCTTTTTLPPLTITVTLSNANKTALTTAIYPSIPFTLSPLTPSVANTTTTTPSSRPSSAISSDTTPSITSAASTEKFTIITPGSTTPTRSATGSQAGPARPSMSVLTLGGSAQKRAFNPLSPVMEMLCWAKR